MSHCNQLFLCSPYILTFPLPVLLPPSSPQYRAPWARAYFKQQEIFSAAVLVSLCVSSFLCSSLHTFASHSSSEGGRELSSVQVPLRGPERKCAQALGVTKQAPARLMAPLPSPQCHAQWLWSDPHRPCRRPPLPAVPAELLCSGPDGTPPEQTPSRLLPPPRDPDRPPGPFCAGPNPPGGAAGLARCGGAAGSGGGARPGRAPTSAARPHSRQPRSASGSCRRRGGRHCCGAGGARQGAMAGGAANGGGEGTVLRQLLTRKGSARITESGSCLCTRQPQQSMCLRALSRRFLNLPDLGL